jgi:hypothetical protein
MQNLQTAQYESFDAIRTQRCSNGLALLPTSGPYPQPASAVALHGGLCYDIVVYHIVRRGAPPECPSPITTNPNRVFLEGERTALFPIKDVTGITTYVAYGYLLFGILAPEGLASTFYIGNLPFLGIDVDEQIPGNYFRYDLISQKRSSALTDVPRLSSMITGILEKS